MDMECAICLYDLEEDGPTVTCRHCHKKFHKRCVLQYFRMARKCWNCDQPMPDPNIPAA